MSDSSDDMAFYSGFCDDADDDDLCDFEEKKHEIIEYCYQHLNLMWAAKITSILLGCDFRDTKNHAELYLRSQKDEN